MSPRRPRFLAISIVPWKPDWLPTNVLSPCPSPRTTKSNCTTVHKMDPLFKGVPYMRSSRRGGKCPTRDFMRHDEKQLLGAVRFSNSRRRPARHRMLCDLRTRGRPKVAHDHFNGQSGMISHDIYTGLLAMSSAILAEARLATSTVNGSASWATQSTVIPPSLALS